MKRPWNPGENRYGSVTYAQHGEDLMILNFFDLIGIEKPSYMDIGAYHPRTISNTSLLYDRGCRGLNVEANENLIQDFKTERPKDTVLNVGVGPEDCEREFLMYTNDHGCNTFVEGAWKPEGARVMAKKKTKMVTINYLVNVFFGGLWPDLVSMDIEELDFDVIESAQFDCDIQSNSPMLWVIEVRKHDDQRFKILMNDLGYFCWCRMQANLFFVRKDFEALVR